MITPGTPQYNLASAQDAANNDPKFARQGKPGANSETFCNMATCQIVRDTGAPTDGLVDAHGIPNLANIDARMLANSSQWHPVSADEAQRLADQGVTVLAVQSNPGGHGHIVTVRPELLPGLQHDLGQQPLVNNIGASREITTADDAFRSRPATYYAPISNQKH